MSTQTKHYKQLTQSQRYQLQALRKNGLSLQAVAETLGVDKSTVSRELKRNSGPDGYCPEAAEQKKTDRKRNAHKAKKRDEQHKQIVAKGLSLGWSQENISCRMKIELPDQAISHTTIYHLIAQDKVNGGTLYQALPRFGKTRWKGGKRKAGRSLIPDRKDITERPDIVEQRARPGDWEGDTVYGQDAHLVTLVDRKSRLTLIGKVDSKNAETVANKMIEMLKRAHGAKTARQDHETPCPARTSARNVVLREAFFCFLFRPPLKLFTSLRRFRAICRKPVRISDASPRRILQSSSPIATSSFQCSLFSINQCSLVACASFSADISAELM